MRGASAPRAGTPSSVGATALACWSSISATAPVFLPGAAAVGLRQDLGLSAAGLGLAVSMFHLTSSIAAPRTGRLVDDIGAMRSLRIAAALSTIALWGVAVSATTAMALGAWLALAGLAQAFSQPAANRLLVSVVHPLRLGLSFGVKQSAPPLASMLAGAVVPTTVVVVGWRSSFALASALTIGILLRPGARLRSRPKPQRPGGEVAREPLPHRSAVALLGVSLALSFAAISSALTFYVDSAVAVGASQQLAGAALAVASLGAVTARVGFGFLSDRMAGGHLRLTAAMIALGSVGFALLGTGQTGPMAAGLVLALSAAWGTPGIFWYSMVRAYPDTPGRISGTLAPVALGGVAGPILIGLAIDHFSHRTAWHVCAALSVLAAIGIVWGGERLGRLQRAGASS